MENSNTKEASSFAFSNSLPSDLKEQQTLAPLTTSEKRITRHILFSHIISLVLAIPTIVLFAIDLRAYLTRAASSLSHPQAGQYSKTNPILILDILCLILLAFTILYAAAYLSSRRLITPNTIQAYVILIFIADAILCVGIQAVSDTALSLRTSNSATSCQRFLYLDARACDSYRRTIMRAAGAMGIVTSIAIHIRWAAAFHVWWCRGRSQKS